VSINLAAFTNLIQKSIETGRIEKNTVYLSLPGVYPMLTRIGLVRKTAILELASEICGFGFSSVFHEAVLKNRKLLTSSYRQGK
jgi:hypothetical protein